MRSQKTSESADTSSDTARKQPVDPVALSPVMEFLGIGILLALLLFS
jgi:hypothetical protein